jgi:N-acetylmuramoyl-L-alanine amidase
MGRSPLALAIALSLAVPTGGAAAPTRRAKAAKVAARRPAKAAARSATLTRAKAAMTAVMRDRTKRRFRHNWERGIAGLLRAARGRDAPAATLEAARARYALYRWSASEGDRDKALLLAARAARLGAPEARTLASAIRREAGARRPAKAAARGATLVQAKAAMTAVMRDRTKRRFRHNWDRAIAGLLRAARGRDAPAATLEAARARYALYRWSANEEDRDKALLLAARAARLGAPEARTFASAIRREAGEDRPARGRGVPTPADVEEEAAPDPTLEEALADLSAARGSALPLGSDGGAGAARVSEVRTWSSEDYTRVAVYLSHWVGWNKFELQPAPDQPRRIALDFRPAVLDGAARAKAVPGQQVDRVRAAQHDPETVRVVLDLPGADVVQAFVLDDPPRLVLDVGTRPASTAPEIAGGETPPAESATAAAKAVPARDHRAPAKAAASRRASEGTDEPGSVRRIVVDAGHGGHDPGAIGPRRVREKNVTLAIARRLAKKLRADGFEVVLTRRGDRYLALEERTAIANTARGDLFVSIHANAHPRRNRAGIETWVLNLADGRYASRLAARENGLDLDGEGEATRILTDLDAKASAGASGRLARLVQREVTAGVRARIGEVRDLGVKSALFYVLLGARMPAVLVETGFISNREEERRLASARYQNEVAGGIARAVSSFARSTDRVAAR